ncbi:MAG TPA: hypothetical protein VGI76_09145 [Solirubrobacteraceae bacterium]|jgi:hypothetical protein
MSARRLLSTVVGALGPSSFILVLWSASALAASPPLLTNQYVTGVYSSAVTLNAQLNPMGFDTTYRFEYGTGLAYGTSVPVPDGDIGSGVEDVTVNQSLEGLQPATTYHYRVVASSAEGTTESSDGVFRTYAIPVNGADSCPNARIRGVQFSSYLPDCRAYEMVSPPDKSGGNIATDPTYTQSAAGGNAIKYDSLTAFGDSQGITGRGAEYIAQRGTDGWSSHSIDPPQTSPGFGIFTSSAYVALSEDLSKGVFYARSPVLPGHPNVEKAANLYLRDDTLSGPPGSYELLTDSATVQPPIPPGVIQNREIAVAGVSADYKHVFFETNANLTAEASGLSTEFPKAYEWDEGAVRLVGILPNGTPAEGSIPGRGAGSGKTPTISVQETWNFNSISRDGSRAIFETVPFGYFQNRDAPPSSNPIMGELYMRVNHAETIKLNSSELSGGPDPNGPQPAMFEAATPDDSQVFFITSENLTDESSGYPPVQKLYRYEVSAPAGHHLTLISVDAGSLSTVGADIAQYVVGLTDDGSYVYFVGEAELLPGLPPSSLLDSRRLYVWHEGTVRYIASHNEDHGDWVLRAGDSGVTWGEGELHMGDTFRLSADGKTVMFLSKDPETAQVAGYENVEAPGGEECLGNSRVGSLETCYELYVYTLNTGKLVCVSCASSGASPVSEPRIERAAEHYPGGPNTPYLNRALSADGRYAFFDTGDALVPQDTNGRRDVYEYDTLAGEVHLISGGTCACDSYFVDASADGHDVFFTTHQQLVRADFDSSADLYDAKVEGGLPGQNGVPAAPCEGDDCQGPAVSAPTFSLPASATFAGVGNTPTAKPSAKSKVTHKAKKHKKKKRRKAGKQGRGTKASRKHAARRPGR